jgi:hypothetical protein
MKRLFLIGILVGCAINGFSQSPASFSYKVKKLDKQHYELTIAVHIQSPWHIYAQSAPAPVLPTTILFSKNPLVELKDKPVEKGDLVTKHDEVFDADLKYYSGKVEFVQEIRLKAPVKTNLSGTIQYMACTDEKCIKPAPEQFSVTLE